MNKLIYLSIFSVVLLLSSCSVDDSEDNNLSGSFHAVINGISWDADSEKVGLAITHSPNPYNKVIYAVKEIDSSGFQLYLPDFYAADTLLTFPTNSLSFAFHNHYWENAWYPNPGVFYISRTEQDGIQTYTGTFSGEFKAVGDSTNILTVTGGTFTINRY